MNVQRATRRVHSKCYPARPCVSPTVTYAASAASNVGAAVEARRADLRAASCLSSRLMPTDGAASCGLIERRGSGAEAFSASSDSIAAAKRARRASRRSLASIVFDVRWGSGDGDSLSDSPSVGDRGELLCPGDALLLRTMFSIKERPIDSGSSGERTCDSLRDRAATADALCSTNSMPTARSPSTFSAGFGDETGLEMLVRAGTLTARDGLRADSLLSATEGRRTAPRSSINDGLRFEARLSVTDGRRAEAPPWTTDGRRAAAGLPARDALRSLSGERCALLSLLGEFTALSERRFAGEDSTTERISSTSACSTKLIRLLRGEFASSITPLGSDVDAADVALAMPIGAGTLRTSPPFDEQWPMSACVSSSEKY